MSYYTDLRANDVLEWVRPLLDTKAYTCRRSDGKFELGPITEPTKSPWHHIDFAANAVCPYLQHVFNVVSPRTPAGKFIPSRCQSCWKIVIRPRTLKELFVLEGILEGLRWPSKCGIERRSYTPTKYGRYGGYIYNESEEEGLEKLVVIRKIISDDSELGRLDVGGEPVEAYLKRACTEMEAAFPDSTTWSVSKEQERVERLLNWLVVIDIPATHSATHMLNKVHMTWIEWACENGDETYLEYTDGKVLYRPAVRYERKVKEESGVIPFDKTVGVGLSSQAVSKEIPLTETKEKK